MLEGVTWVAASEWAPLRTLSPRQGWGLGQDASSHVGAPPAADRCLLGFPPTDHLDPFKAARGNALGRSLQILDTCQGPLAAAN